MTRSRAGPPPASGSPHFLDRVASSPPRSWLEEIVATLEGRGITVALGGSGLLAALGLGRAIRDWDLTTDAPYAQVMSALAGRPCVAHGPDALHADHKLALAGGAVEIIVGFAYSVPGSVVRVPTFVSARVFTSAHRPIRAFTCDMTCLSNSLV